MSDKLSALEISDSVGGMQFSLNGLGHDPIQRFWDRAGFAIPMTWRRD